jgi:AraC family transcriptional regulator
LPQVIIALERDSWCGTQQLAAELQLHPAWLARAYRSAMGEGILESLRRRRVARAASLLRSSNSSLAEVAAEAGFYDQSHMTRSFQATIDRTPSKVRAERQLLTSFLTQ